MDNKILLINAITMLYRQSQIKDNADRSVDLAKKVVSFVKIPDTASNFDNETKIIKGLVQLLLTMCSDPKDHEYEEIEILQRVRTVSDGNDSVYEALYDGISKELMPNALKRLTLNLHRTLTNFFRENEAIAVFSKGFSELKFNREKIPCLKTYIAEHIAALEPYTVDAMEKDPAIVSHVSFTDRESMREVYVSIQKEADGTERIKTGWQGLNRMYRGGFRYGDEVVIGALQHNYKSSLTLSMFRQMVTYNKPPAIDIKLKPLALRISFEDDINLNMRYLYIDIIQNETGKVLTDEEVMAKDPAEIADYVHSKMTANGWCIDLLRVDPTNWSYIELCNKIIDYESQGYCVKILMVDYLTLLPTTGCKQGVTGADIRDMYRRMRAFCNPRKILFITPHQLSTEAKLLIRDGAKDFVKKIANKGYYDGCRTLDQEVDAELYIHKEVENGVAYLTFQRGKHRISGKTDDIDLYCVLPFTPKGGILDDINGADTSRRKVGGGPIGSSDEVPFWDTPDKPF